MIKPRKSILLAKIRDISYLSALCVTIVISGLPSHALTPSEVQKKGRGFSSCQGCDATIYLYKGSWYDVEQPGGFVSPGRSENFKPVLHNISGVKLISKDVAFWDNQYQCAWDSLKGPRRPVICTKKGWQND
jgi:hypothetical protein